ncbi:MAG TPA: glycoside hydrolase family 2 TIM barrel-domain containing protein [Fibrobacteraceae bacterium]|nr:glycoside hydrolase family 2 TIM barrel-domain containing protein [Fibrobacteraceae bacterium]
MSTIVDLNGEWDFLWDTDGVGFSHRWYVTCPEGLEKVQVPHLWEQAFNKPGLVGYYFKKFTIDASENSKRIFLRFERIATQATVWLNGKYLGEHFGAYTPFQLETAKAVKVGEENLLVIRVSTADNNGKMDLGRAEDEGVERFASSAELPVGLPWSHYPFAGICGPICLILGNRAIITSCTVVPNPDQERISLDLTFSNPRNYMAKLRFIVVNPRGEAHEMDKEIKLEKENHSMKLLLGFKDPEFWSPEHPNLYRIEICLEKSLPILRRFGFRKFDCIKGDFFLNDKVVRLQGLCYSQQDQNGGLWDMNLDRLRKDLQAIRSAGFHVIRSGGAPLSEAALDICDELGLMVFQEFPIHNQRSSTKGLDRVRQMTEEVIVNGRSHVSVVAWVLGAENGTMMLENGTKLLKNVDQFDQTRPVFSNINCVYLDNCQTFKRDTGKIMGVTNERVALFPSHRLHLRMNPNQTLSQFLTQYCNKDLQDVEVPDLTLGDSQFQEDYQTFVSETHGKVLVTLRNHSLLHNMAAVASRMKGSRAQKNVKAMQALNKQLQAFVNDGPGKGLWSDFSQFMAAANEISLKSKIDQINALQSNPQVSGFFLDQWADVGTDMGGLVNEFRDSKGCESFLQEITKPNRILVAALERAVKAKTEVVFQLAVISNDRPEKAEVVIRMLDAQGKVLSTQKRTVNASTTITQLGECKISAPSKIGPATLQVDLIASGEILHSAKEPLLVLEAPVYKDAMKSVCFLDESESSSDAMKHISGKEKVIFTSSLSSWNESILDRLASVVKEGKSLIISEMNQDDIDAFNSCSAFNQTLEGHFTTGANGASFHYLNENGLFPATKGSILDCTASAILPSMSLNEIPKAKIMARSISIEEGELRHGVDLQMISFGKGKILLCQFALLDNLENNPLADYVFSGVVKGVL